MNYLLDTNAISEWVKPRPDPGIVRWLDEVDEDRTYLSVITIGEIRRGVQRLAAGRRRDRLDRWLSHELRERFGDRMLAVDTEVADEWGRLLARAEDADTAVGGSGRLLAAPARVPQLPIAPPTVSHHPPPRPP